MAEVTKGTLGGVRWVYVGDVAFHAQSDDPPVIGPIRSGGIERLRAR